MLPPSNEFGAQMIKALQAQMPGLKTQAQFNVFMLAFDALRVQLDAIFIGDSNREEQGREALNKALDAARQVTDLGNKFQEVPEAAKTASNPFVRPPDNAMEYDTQKKLLSELHGIATTPGLQEWYERTKTERDSISSQTLRNILIDAIREKRQSLKGHS